MNVMIIILNLYQPRGYDHVSVVNYAATGRSVDGVGGWEGDRVVLQMKEGTLG